MNCKKQNAILLEENTILRSEVTSLNQLIQKNKETHDASKEEVEKYIESKKIEKGTLYKRLTKTEENLNLKIQENKYLIKSLSGAKRALENSQADNKYSIESQVEEVLRLKTANNQMDRTIKALRNEIEVIKEERNLQRSLDRKEIIETKKTLSSANNKITMIEQMLDNAKKNSLAQRKEIESLKKRLSNDRIEARNKNNALRESCDSLTMQLKRSEAVVMEKISLLEDLERKMYFSNMNTNTLNSQIDALSLQLNCVEEDYFNVLDEFLEKSIDMQRNYMTIQYWKQNNTTSSLQK